MQIMQVRIIDQLKKPVEEARDVKELWLYSGLPLARLGLNPSQVTGMSGMISPKQLDRFLSCRVSISSI